MKYFTMFSGIGAPEIAMQRVFPDAISVGYSEIDKFANQVMERRFPNVKNYGDATTIKSNELPDFDLLIGGFPCQAFSVAGKRLGFEDTRGTLFFDVARILRDKRPRYFILENVKGLLSHDSGKTFQTILEVLSDAGYGVSWSIHNSKNYGVPQNRERIYIIGHSRGERRPEVFPVASDNGETTVEGLSTISAVTGVKGVTHSPTLDTMYMKGLGSKQARPCVVQPFTVSKIDRKNKEYTLKDTEVSGTLTATMWKGIDALNRTGVKQLNNPTHSNDRVYSDDGLSPTLNTMQGSRRQPFILDDTQGFGGVREYSISPSLRSQRYGVKAVLTPDRLNKRQNGRRMKENGEPSFTLNTQDRHGIYDGVKIRRLTPTECVRLQGFPDGWNDNVSETQQYKQAGNAMTVNVVEHILRELNETL